MSRSEPPGDAGIDANAEDTPPWRIERERHLSEWAALFRTEPQNG
jgi:hypothetical protein